jgi:hypothetical protein
MAGHHHKQFASLGLISNIKTIGLLRVTLKNAVCVLIKEKPQDNVTIVNYVM